MKDQCVPKEWYHFVTLMIKYVKIKYIYNMKKLKKQDSKMWVKTWKVNFIK